MLLVNPFVEIRKVTSPRTVARVTKGGNGDADCDGVHEEDLVFDAVSVSAWESVAI